MWGIIKKVAQAISGTETDHKRPDFESFNEQAMKRIEELKQAEQVCREDRDKIWKDLRSLHDEMGELRKSIN